MEKNVETGDPVNPPIWWIAPNDPIALGCRADKEDHRDFADDETLQRSLSRDESYCKSGLYVCHIRSMTHVVKPKHLLRYHN